MPRVKRTSIWTLLALLLGAATAGAAGPGTLSLAPLAHSSLITLEGTTLPGAMVLQVRPTSGGTAPQVTEFALTLDGTPAPATLQPDGSWRVTLPAGATRPPARFEATITHDGIREVLGGAVAPAAPGAAAGPAEAGALGIHKQIVWWVLNIVIVLVAAIAISRRTS